MGGIFLPIMLNQLINGTAGFGWGVRASAFIVLACLAVANLLMSSHPAVTARPKVKPDIRSALTDVPYLLLITGALFILWGIYFPFFYEQLFAIEHGVDPTVSFYTLAILNGTSIFGRTFPNLFIHRFGVLNLLIPFCFICGALLFTLFGTVNTATCIVFSIIYGFFSGGFLSLVTLAAGSMARHESEIGMRVGLAYALASFGALTGNPIDGALLGSTYVWKKAIIFSAVSIIGGTGFICAARWKLVAQRGTQFV